MRSEWLWVALALAPAIPGAIIIGWLVVTRITAAVLPRRAQPSAQLETTSSVSARR